MAEHDDGETVHDEHAPQTPPHEVEATVVALVPESDPDTEFRRLLYQIVRMHTQLTDQIRVLTPLAARALHLEEEAQRLAGLAARQEEHRIHQEEAEFTENVIRRRTREERLLAFGAEAVRLLTRALGAVGEFFEHPGVRYALIAVIVASLTWLAAQLQSCTQPEFIVSLPPPPESIMAPMNTKYLLDAIQDGRADHVLRVNRDQWAEATRGTADAVTPLPAPRAPRRTPTPLAEPLLAVVPSRRLATV